MLHLITIFSDHSNICYVDTDLQMMKGQGQGAHVALHVQLTTFFTDGIRKFSWNEVTNVRRSSGITLKNDSVLVLEYVL
jgi:hypothetical protein